MGLIDFVLHIDVHLQQLLLAYGPWIYGILFLIVFAETGLVVAPVLPGDSLLFATGALAASGGLNPHLVVLVLIFAAFCGDNVNYLVGHWAGKRLLNTRWVKRAYLERTQSMFERHGGKTIIIARFLPIIRTYVPFTAGLSGMPYRRFMAFSVLGSVLWVCVGIYAGLLFGGLPIVKNHFTLLILGIVLISLLPALWGILSARGASKTEK